MNFIRKGYYERMDKKENSKMTPLQFVFRVVQGALIGLGAVLPGISGGVLSVIFGIYKPIMELLSNPIANFKTHVPKLIPVVIGGAVGFLGVANVTVMIIPFSSFWNGATALPNVICLMVGVVAAVLLDRFNSSVTVE